MALNPGPAWADVKARLESGLPLTVYDAQAPEDADIVLTNGLFNPFLVLYSGGPIRSGTDHHLVGSRNDTTVLYWTIAVYAPTPDVTDLIVGQILDLMTGYKPPDCGEMLLEGGLSYKRGLNAVRPTQYVREIAYNARSNLSWNA